MRGDYAPRRVTGVSFVAIKQLRSARRDDDGVVFTGKRYDEERREDERRKRKKKTEEEEIVEGWNGNGRGLPEGRGRRVTPEEKQAEWRRLSDRAYSPLCFRSQARPAGSSFPLYTTHAHSHARTRTCIRMRAFHPPFSPPLFLLRVAHTEPSVFHPRGRLVDLPFRLPAIPTLGAVTRALRRHPLLAFSLTNYPRSFSSSLRCYIVAYPTYRRTCRAVIASAVAVTISREETPGAQVRTRAHV